MVKGSPKLYGGVFICHGLFWAIIIGILITGFTIGPYSEASEAEVSAAILSSLPDALLLGFLISLIALPFIACQVES